MYSFLRRGDCPYPRRCRALRKEGLPLSRLARFRRYFGRVMDVLTLRVAVIGGISLLVGSVGIFTMMWISVGERVPAGLDADREVVHH